MDDSLATLLEFVARPSRGFAGLSLDDFQAALVELGGEPVVVTRDQVLAVLQGLLDCELEEGGVRDWAILLRWGMHPCRITFRRWPWPPRRIVMVRVPTIKDEGRLRVRYEPAEKAEILEKVIRNIQGVSSARGEIRLDDIQAWQSAIGSAPSSDRAGRPV